MQIEAKEQETIAKKAYTEVARENDYLKPWDELTGDQHHEQCCNVHNLLVRLKMQIVESPMSNVNIKVVEHYVEKQFKDLLNDKIKICSLPNEMFFKKS